MLYDDSGKVEYLDMLKLKMDFSMKRGFQNQKRLPTQGKMSGTWSDFAFSETLF